MQINRTRALNFAAAVVAAAGFGAATPAQSQVVFEADFESGAVGANVGTLSFIGGAQSIDTTVTGDGTHTDWGTGSLFADRIGTGTEAGFKMTWELTNPVELDGASIDFEHIIRRFNTSDVKSHFVSGYDSEDNLLFSLKLVDREDSGLANIADYLDNDTDTDERQRQNVAYVDPVSGDSLFSAAQLASGDLPDTNDRTDGTNDFEQFFGRDNLSDGILNEEEAGLFSVALTDTGWTLNATPRQVSTLTPIATIELPYTNPGINLARVEIDGETAQAGGFWDNILIQGTAFEAGAVEGDYNADGFVSQPDLDLVLLNWGDAILPAGFDEAALSAGPFDGLISQNELDGVLLNWGNGTPPVAATVPEPAGAALFVAAGFVLARRRNRLF